MSDRRRVNANLVGVDDVNFKEKIVRAGHACYPIFVPVGVSQPLGDLSPRQSQDNSEAFFNGGLFLANRKKLVDRWYF